MDFFIALKRYLKSEWYNFRNYHKIKLITLLLIIILFPITIPLAIIGFIIGMLYEMILGKREYDRSIYKLITKDSIEEKIQELQEKKSKLIDDVLSTEETFINKLSKEDILALFD